MRSNTHIWKRFLAALLSFAMLLGMIPAFGGRVAVEAEAALVDKNGVTIDEYITMPITIRDFAADGMLFEYNEVYRKYLGADAKTYTKTDRLYPATEAAYTAVYNHEKWDKNAELATDTTAPSGTSYVHATTDKNSDGVVDENDIDYTGLRVYSYDSYKFDVFFDGLSGYPADRTYTNGAYWYCVILDANGNVLKVLDLEEDKKTDRNANDEYDTYYETVMNEVGGKYSVWAWRNAKNLPAYNLLAQITEDNKDQFRFAFDVTTDLTDNSNGALNVYLGRNYHDNIGYWDLPNDPYGYKGIYVYSGDVVDARLGGLSGYGAWHCVITNASTNKVVKVITNGSDKSTGSSGYQTADYKFYMVWSDSSNTEYYDHLAAITESNMSEYAIVIQTGGLLGSALFVERTITVNEADTKGFGLLMTSTQDYINNLNDTMGTIDGSELVSHHTYQLDSDGNVVTDASGDPIVLDPLEVYLKYKNEETGEYEDYVSQDVYGALIRTNLVGKDLDDDGKPVYTQDTVEYLAKFMQQIMAVPLYNTTTTTYGNAGSYNTFHVMGTKVFDDYGYVHPSSPDAKYDLAEMIRMAVANSSATNKLGTYAASKAKFDAGQLRDVTTVETWYDAAYYLLHNLWRDSSLDTMVPGNDGYGMPVPKYDRLHLIQTTNEDGEKCYVFNAKYDSTTYDFSTGQIFNSSFGSYTTETRPYSPAYTKDGKTYTSMGNVLPAARFDPLGPSGAGVNEGFTMSADTYGDFAKNNAMNWAEYYDETNYHMTLEGHAQFTYHAEANQYFTFTGDDDVYLYVNGVRVLDVGGAHSIAKVSIDLNDVAAVCGLEDGGSYRFDFFFMERHGTAANFGMETNIQIEDPAMSTSKVGYQNGENTGYNGYVIPDVPMVYEFGIENNSDIGIVDLTFADERLEVSLTPSAIKLNTPKQKTDAEGNPLTDENGEPVYEDETGTTIDELSVTIYNKPTADGTVTVKHTYPAGSLTDSILKGILTTGLDAGEKIVIHGFEHTILDTEWEFRTDSNGKRLSNDYYYNQVHTTAKSSLNRDKVLEGNDNWVVQKMPGSLTITKVLAADASSALQNATFTMQVLLEGKKIPAGTTYTVGKETRTVQIDGRIPLAAGETAVITGIPNGTRFEVQELPGTANGTAYWPSYEAVHATAGVNGVTGTIIENAVVGAIVTNHEDMLETDKRVTATEDANAFELTLEAYALGEQYTVAMTKPADIILVLDHSASMYTPAGAPGILDSTSLYNGDAIDRSDISITKGAHRGYYVAQSSETQTWFIMEYVANYAPNDDTTAARWVGYSVPNTESYVNPGSSDTQHTQVQSWVPGEVDANLVFYKSQYAVLYDSLLEFVDDLKNSGVEHNVAIVGFAGSEGDGTRLYVGSEGENNSGYKRYRSALYHENTSQERRDELYVMAMKNVQDATEYQQLLSNIELIETNASFTCPAIGLQLANEVFAANEVNLAERDRIVVLFTDGIPNKKIGGDQDTTETIEEIHNEIVSVAYSVKQQGATIYSISTTTLGTGDRTFLKYASSDYPNAVDYDHPGDAVGEKPIYTRETSSELNLTDIFAEITVNTTTSSVELDETAILKEVLTDYFVLNPEDVAAISVYTQKAKADGTFEDMEILEGAKVTLSSSDGSERKDTVEVTGFDYKDEYISTIPRTVNGEAYYGSKLVVKVKIRTRDGFWGGNNVPTNDSATAIYTPDGQPVEYFPIPEVNVPIVVDVVAKDKTIYYGGNIDTDEDGKEGDELITSVTIGGKEVTVNDDGTFTPSDSWMDDFADASWAEGSTKPESDLSNTNPDNYTYTVEVTPKDDGTTNKSENPGNIAGNIDGDEVKNDGTDLAVPTAGVSDSDTGHIYILVPELTFQDSTTEFGTAAEGYDYESNNFVSVTAWKDMENGKLPGDGIPALDDGVAAPELTLTYTPDKEGNNALKDGAFVTDTKVEVTVHIGDDDITSLSTFHWQDNCDFNGHDDATMDIASHEGEAVSNEFWVHVTLAIVPDTVVIDYGLDVLIDVLANDPYTENIKPALNEIAKNEADAPFGTEAVTGTYGELSIEGDKVRYSLDKDNSMQMNAEDTFRYQAKYTINDKEILLDSTVTVIPATSIYYEDGFVTYTVWNNDSNFSQNTDEDKQWKPTSTTTTPPPTQEQDRPGADQALDALDADNIYGYDGAYTAMSEYSLDSAMKVTVNNDLFAEAHFTFYGTGFDVISLTNSASGTVKVDVYNADDFAADQYKAKIQATKFVDTYYGYKYDNGSWIVSETSDTLYQVPVIKVSDLKYGRYTVVLTVAYIEGLDHKPEEGDQKTSYDFWLDAIRIYDPANDGAGNKVIEDAYKDDHEGWPEYFELRNLIIKSETFNSLNDESVTGIVFIDNTLDTDQNDEYSIADYTNYGPNNELYLAPGQSIAFELSVTGDTVDQIHLGLKSVGGTANAKVYDAADEAKVNILNNESEAYAIATATDLYYNITSLNNKTVVITNTSGSILSITNVKVTYSEDPNSENPDEVTEQSYFKVSQPAMKMALMSLRPQVAAPVLAITRQPVDYAGMVGDNASFTVEAQGEGLTYQWYYRDGDADWGKLSNGTEATVNVEFLAYRNNRQFRCEITDLNGSTVTTDTVTLSAQDVELVITGQPVSAVGAVNEEMVFTVEAVGNGLTYQWYFSDDNGATWQKSGTPGFNTATLLPILRDYRNGYQYRCRISDVFGNAVTSDTVTMTVKTGEISITAQPADVSAAALNQLYSFQVTATGENLTYRWEYSDDGGATWQLSWNDGYDTDTLKARMYVYRDGYLYRCKVTSGLTNSVYTEVAELKLQAPSAEIVKQPVKVSAVAGETILFRVEATGSDLTYAWYRSNDQGATWNKTYLNGYNTDTLTFDATAARAAHYMCQITDGSGTIVWTEPVKLQILSAKLQIVSQPENVVCGNGDTATFKVEAQGDGLKYQWYASADGGETWTQTWLGGYNTDTLSFAVTASRAAKTYKCVITDASGNTVATNLVTIQVNK